MTTHLKAESYREVLTIPGFRALWFGQTLAFLGRAVVHVALAIYVYQLTGSVQALTFTMALEMVPYVFVGRVAGILADRIERKVILIGAYASQAALVACLPFATSLGQMYALVFLGNLMGPAAETVRAAALPSVTGRRLFVRGSSLDIVAFNAANVIGPVLAGLLVAAAGADTTFFVAAGCLLGAVLLTSGVVLPRPTRSPPPEYGTMSNEARAFWRDLKEGMRCLFGHSLLRFLLLLACIATLGFVTPELAAVVYMSDDLGLGGVEYGLLRASVSLGMALAAYVLGRYSRSLPTQRLLVGGIVLAGLAYMATATQPGWIMLLGLWFVSGLAWGANWLVDSTLWARATPDALRGRVYSFADAGIYMAQLTTALAGGWLINALGPTEALFLIGGIMVLGAVAASTLSDGYESITDYGEANTEDEEN